MRPFLLDINVLIALAWRSHVHHRQAQRWFANHREAGFRTCPLTEAGFVRLSSNPRFTPKAVSPTAALFLLERITGLPEHEFWPDDLPVRSAIGTGLPIMGHRQVNDAYLLALARSHGGLVATLDRGLLSVAPDAERAVLIT